MADPKHLGNCYATLGLGESATDAEVEAAFGDVSDFLQSAQMPPRLRRWAALRQKDLDAAYAILMDPAQRYALSSSRREAASGHGSRASSPERRPTVNAGGAKAQPSRVHPAPTAAENTPPVLSRTIKAAVLGLAVVILVGAAYLLYQNGSTRPESSAQAASAAPVSSSAPAEPEVIPVDPARVAELEALVTTDPRNIDALFELGESHFQAGEWEKSIEWFTKLVAVDPKNVHALTDIGTANLNMDRDAAAKESWMKALAVDPNDSQVHYNLGFLYARTEPPDLKAAVTEWETVVRLAPDSSLARVARAHLEGLK